MIIRSIGLMTVINILKGAVSLLLSFYVAKAVSPAEFGLIAFAIPLAALITLLTDLGIANAIVRERSLSKAQSGSALVMMLAFGLVGGGTLALLATPIQWASGLPGVHDVVLGFAVVACFSVWATCPRALVERELQYSTISAVELTALLAGTGGFFFALHAGWGVFALVAFHVILQCIRSLVFLWCARGLFTWVLVPRGIKPLLQTGGWIFASNLLSYASRNLDRFIIAANLGAAAVGLYGFAYQFMTVPLVLLAWPASGVLMSTLSRLNDDIESKKKVVEGFLAITAAAVFPMMASIAFLSSYPLQSFLSDKWLGVDHYIALLAPLGAAQALAVYASATLVADGRMVLNFRLSLLNGLIIPIGFLVSAPFGLSVSVSSYLLLNSIVCGLMIYYMCSTTNISARNFIELLLPGILATIVVVLVNLMPIRSTDSAKTDWVILTSASVFGVFVSIIIFRARLISHYVVLKSLRLAKANAAS
uniref:Polysaccharide biosynthesis protein n=1 Tax=Curvibacter symbiont subsp. Hydra magnipapillata TaxID=667019 RepID=C9Y8B9_CURXX|nr:hypothetical protein Csp_A03700 [Curvibacter putative symbiont of Hydra magnipapillata]